MKNTFISLAVFCLSFSAFAEEKNCDMANPTSATITDLYDGKALVSIGDSKVAQVLYNSMTNISADLMTDGVPSGTVMYRKIGTSLTCFKQELTDCVLFQCNIPFQNIGAGQIGSFK